jgi:hypothetical protein
MGRYDRQIDRAFKDAESRQMARDVIAKFGDTPGVDRYIEAGLHLFADANAAVAAGTKTQDEARELINSTMADGFGAPGHLLDPFMRWYDETVAHEQQDAAANALIDELWESEETRASARDFAARFRGELDIEAALRRSADLDRQVAAGTITQADANKQFGALLDKQLSPEAINKYSAWSQDNAGQDQPQPAEETPTPAQAAQPQATSAQPIAAAPATPAGPTREELQQQKTKWEGAMRAPENSPEWKSYWREGGSLAYLSALRAIEAADVSQTIAGGVVPAQPASAEPAAPGA